VSRAPFALGLAEYAVGVDLSLKAGKKLCASMRGYQAGVVGCVDRIAADPTTE
jgi:hypothetical protein